MIQEIYLKGRVEYPRSLTEGFVGNPTRIQVIEEINKHILFVVEHMGHAKYAVESLRSGAPMTVYIKGRRHSRTWYGYVDSVTELAKDDNTPYTRVVGVGLTYYMKEPANDVFVDVVDTEKELIRSSGLVPAVEGVTHPLQIPLAGKSKWEVLNELADTYNQVVFSTGTTVNVMPIDRIIEVFGIEAITLAWMGSGGSEISPFSLQKFKVPITDNTTSIGLEARQQFGYGVDPLSSRITEIITGESMFPKYQHFIARSMENVAKKLSNPSTVIGIGEGRGHTGVSAGKPVMVRGSEPGPWWLVSRVIHEYVPEENEYMMYLDLLWRPSFDQFAASYRPPRRNTKRQGNDGTSLHREYQPVLDINKRRVAGSVNWRDRARWRPAV